MKVVVDTNVVVSAALRGGGPDAVIAWIVDQPDREWIASQEIATEYLGVLAREKFALPQDILLRWSQLFERVITLIEPDQEVSFPRDPNDAKFLACAKATQADFLITGDRDFMDAPLFADLQIISVAQFRRLFDC